VNQTTSTKHYPEGADRSRALYQRACESLPGGNTRTTVFMKPFPIYASRGEGCRVYDADGVARIDCINNFTSLIHGHAHPAVVAAVQAQLPLGMAFGFPTEKEIDLAELLCARVRSVEQVRFCNSGTEAVMMAIKAARAHTGRPRIAKIEGAYHGSYDYAEVSLDPSPENWGSNYPRSVAYAHGTPQSALDEVLILPFNDPLAASALIRESGGDLACVLIDPMPNRAGLVPATQEYVDAIQEAAKAVGALVIFDEVISFRLNFHGAQHLWRAEPDLTAFGKIIGGGLPVGAVGGKASVMAVFDPSAGKPALPHGGTFSANPMTMAAGRASMLLLDQAAYERLDAMGEKVREGFRRAFADAGHPGRVTGAGSLLRFHVVDREITDYRGAYLNAQEAGLMAALHRGMINHGLLAAGNGLCALSTAMQDADLEAILNGFSAALSHLHA
jgi:glutamate-1-semialdehyde 2,1-aminomutase